MKRSSLFVFMTGFLGCSMAEDIGFEIGTVDFWLFVMLVIAGLNLVYFGLERKPKTKGISSPDMHRGFPGHRNPPPPPRIEEYLVFISKCSDPLRWYRDKVGEEFPLYSENPYCYICLQDKKGYLNIVIKSDAFIIKKTICQ